MKNLLFILLSFICILLIIPNQAEATDFIWESISIDKYMDYIYTCGNFYGFNFLFESPDSISMTKERYFTTTYKISPLEFVVFQITPNDKAYKLELHGFIPSHENESLSFNHLVQCTYRFLYPDSTDQEYKDWGKFLKSDKNTDYYFNGFVASKSTFYDPDTHKLFNEVYFSN